MSTAESSFLLQRGLFAAQSMDLDTSMYGSAADGAVQFDRTRAVISPGAVATADTYFGRFPAAYWQRWTRLGSVTATVDFTTDGVGKISLLGTDARGNERTIKSIEVTGSGSVALESSLDTFFDGGSLSLEFRAVGETLTVENVRWESSTVPAEARGFTVAICTFNRADDCVATLEALVSDSVVLDRVDAIYVVDQGADRVDSREQFSGIVAASRGKLRYLNQPNLGGAGGFSRGLIESGTEFPNSDVILMDDDIICEPESLLRISAFANFTRTPAIVGAQMLLKMQPTFLHVSGEGTRLDRLQPGRWSLDALHSADLREERVDRHVEAEYNGWWTCLIPAHVPDSIGMPLPVFFRWDDIEYGVRAKANSIPTITMPNAGVWHADFTWKDMDDWSNYYHVRNGLIAAALRVDLNPKALAKWMTRDLLRYLVAMQYGLAATTLLAIEDFLSGPAILDDGGRSSLGRVREMRAQFPDTFTHASVADAGIADTEVFADKSGHPPLKNLIDLVLAKRLLGQLRGRVRPGTPTISSDRAEWWHVSLYGRAVVTDSSQAGVRIRMLDRAVLRDHLRRVFRIHRQLVKHFPIVAQQYREAEPLLTTKDNWRRLFDSP